MPQIRAGEYEGLEEKATVIWSWRCLQEYDHHCFPSWKRRSGRQTLVQLRLFQPGGELSLGSTIILTTMKIDYRRRIMFDILSICKKNTPGEKVPDCLQHQHARHERAGSQVHPRSTEKPKNISEVPGLLWTCGARVGVQARRGGCKSARASVISISLQ